ncbi:MAG: hypothetical protein WBQ23_08010 [Bacteroidota bacterium]
MFENVGKRFSFPFSIALIVIGALLLFGNVGWLGFNSLIGLLALYWPVVFIARGISRFSKGSSGFGRGIRDIALGLILQVIMLGWLPDNLLQYWPYLSIGIGIWLILLPRRNAVQEQTVEASELQTKVLFNGARIEIRSQQFEGGRLSATVAAVECDFSQCSPRGKLMKLELHLLLSRVQLYISDEWRVVAEVSNGMGRLEDHRDLGNPPEGTGAPELRISGSLTLASLHILDPIPVVDSLDPDL